MLISCQSCGAQISDKAESCPKCAATPDVYLGATLKCSECGNQEREAYLACRECGAPMPVVVAPSSEPQPEPYSKAWDGAYEEPLDSTSPSGPPAQANSDGGGWSGKILAFVFFALAFGGVRVWNQYNSSPERNWDRQDTVEILLESDSGEFFQTIRSEFPGDFETIVTEMHTVISDRTASDEEAFRVGFNATRDFTMRNAGYVFLAPDDELDAVITRTSEMLEVAKTASPEVCAAFTSGAAPSASASAGALDDFQDISMLTVKAIVAGKTKPTQRAVATEDEWNGFLEPIWANIEPSTYQELETSADPTTMSTEALCDFGLHTMRVIDAMPKERAAYWYANMYRDTAQMLEQ